MSVVQANEDIMKVKEYAFTTCATFSFLCNPTWFDNVVRIYIYKDEISRLLVINLCFLLFYMSVLEEKKNYLHNFINTNTKVINEYYMVIRK